MDIPDMENPVQTLLPISSKEVDYILFLIFNPSKMTQIATGSLTRNEVKLYKWEDIKGYEFANACQNICINVSIY